jgi:hypothetical protein
MTRPRLSETRIGILRAMLSRRAPLILGNRTWFVRGWSTFVSPADVEALRNGGWIEPPADAPARGSHRLFVLTEAGRDFAARAAARAIPPSRAEEIAA